MIHAYFKIANVASLNAWFERKPAESNPWFAMMNMDIIMIYVEYSSMSLKFFNCKLF